MSDRDSKRHHAQYRAVSKLTDVISWDENIFTWSSGSRTSMLKRSSGDNITSSKTIC